MNAQEAFLISDEVQKENGQAELDLRAKCQWEKLPRVTVILTWGDPRKWGPKEKVWIPMENDL